MQVAVLGESSKSANSPNVSPSCKIFETDGLIRTLTLPSLKNIYTCQYDIKSGANITTVEDNVILLKHLMVYVFNYLLI